MPERQPLTDFYPPEIATAFPTFENEVASFLERNSGTVVNFKTPAVQVEKYAQELQVLATTVASGIKNWKIDIVSLYLKATQPAREAGILRPEDEGRVGLVLGKHRYHILEREKQSIPASNILLLLQRVPYGEDTGAEVHGLKRIGDQLVPDKNVGGIEVYLPLVDDVTFYVNDQIFKPRALEGLITVLPGDTHHHIKTKNHGPVRVLIFGGFGFGYGIKTKENFEVSGFSQIPRFTLLI